jgi:hypothetical protein
MPEKPETWMLDAATLLDELDLTPGEKRVAKVKAGDILDAIARSDPGSRRESVGGPAATMSAGAPLYIPGVKLHLNVTQAAKNAVVGAVSLLVKGIVMSKEGLVELSQPLTATALGALFAQFTKLTDGQRDAMDAICRLKRERKLPGYAPTTKEIAEALKVRPAAVEKELKPLIGKAVAHDPKAKTWKILF